MRCVRLAVSLAKIRTLNVSFECVYSSPFVEKMTSKGTFCIKDLAFEADFSVVKTVSLEISRLDAQLGESTINIENPPAIFWLFQHLFNNYKGLITFIVNRVGPFVLNFVLSDSPLAISVPLFKSYLLDLAPERQVSSNNNVTVLYSLFEVYDEDKDDRIEVPSPAPLDKEPIDKKNSFEIAINDHLSSTLIATLTANNDFRLKLTDKAVHEATMILYLRASSFAYFIPGLKEYGETPLTADVIFDKNTVVEVGEKNVVTVAGRTTVNLCLDGKTETVVEMSAKTSLTFAANVEGKMLSVKLAEISIQDLEFKKYPGSRPDANTIKNEFNALFKVVVGAVSNYVLAEKFDIEELLNLIPFLHISVSSCYLVMKTGIVKVGGVVAFK